MHQGLHKVLGVIPMADKTFSLRLERKGMSFVAGQCVNLGLPNTGINREYSSYSGEGEDELRFLIREVEDGQVTPELRRLRPGDLVEVDGAYGLFTLPQPVVTGARYVFVGTGTGIAPFRAFVRSYPGIDYQVVHGVRYAREMYDRQDYAPGRYVGCVSGEAGGEWRGRVTTYLTERPAGKDAVYYLCGNRHMINDVYDLLRAQGVSSSHIVTEVFF